MCTLCPAQCNVSLTVRDERALRVLARENAEVDDGWLCDKGRFAYQSFHVDERITQPLLRDGGQLRPVSWERALSEAASGLARAGARTGAIAGGQSTNEEGFLLARLLREGLGSPHLDSRRAGALPLELHRALGAPGPAGAHLRPRVRPRGARARRRAGRRRADLRPAPAQGRAPPRPEAGGRLPQRELARRPARRCPCATRPAPARRSPQRSPPPCAAAPTWSAWPRRRAPSRRRCASWQRCCAVRPSRRRTRRRGPMAPRSAGGRGAVGRAAHGRARRHRGRGRAARRSPSAWRWPAPRARAARSARRRATGAGLREAGVLPNAGPGLADPHPRCEAGATPRRSREGLADGELGALYLLHCDPLRDLPSPTLWERALAAREHRGRPRRVPHRGHPRARRRRVPGGGLCREGGHDRAPRRAPAAPASRDRPPGRGARRVAGARRAGAAPRARPRRAEPARWPPRSCSRRSPSTPG